jgi:nucleotide-binding universal stress UspA family protein
MSNEFQPLPVVAGIDGSAASLAAARFAAGEARLRRTALRLVFATPWPDDDGWVVQRARNEIADAAGDDVEVAAVALPGSPVQVLRQESAGAQLLVVGGRGVEGVSGLLRGSTAAALVTWSACPVIVLPDDHAVGVSRRRSVVAGVAGGPDDEEVLGFAFAEAATRGTDLIAVHAWRDTVVVRGGTGEPSAGWSSEHADEQRMLAEILAGWREKEPDVPVCEVLVRERPARALLGAGMTAELLVVGRRHRHLLGSTAHAVVHRATCPVAVVPGPAGR